MTRRCCYCRPRWTWGIRSRILRKIVAAIWPPHLLSPDDGEGYTDGMCHKALAKYEAYEKAQDLKVWKRKWREWEKLADSFTCRRTFPKYWLRDYQAARRYGL